MGARCVQQLTASHSAWRGVARLGSARLDGSPCSIFNESNLASCISSQQTTNSEIRVLIVGNKGNLALQIVYFLATDNVALRQIAEGKLRSVVHTNNMIERGRLEGCALLPHRSRWHCREACARSAGRLGVALPPFPPSLPSYLPACVRTVPLVSRTK